MNSEDSNAHTARKTRDYTRRMKIIVVKVYNHCSFS